ncbi:YncE family protein [bacterium]|nr:YncE family protein [bacterium]
MNHILTTRGKHAVTALLLVFLVLVALSGSVLPARAVAVLLADFSGTLTDPGVPVQVVSLLPAGGEGSAIGGQEITWSGDGGDGDWSNPHNWAGSRVPGPADTARLVGSAPDARVDAAFGGVVAGLFLGADYAGTLRLEHALLVRGDLEMAGGTLQGGEAGLDVNGTVRVSGGLLVTPAGAAMNVVMLDIAAPGVVRLGTNGKLNLSGSGQPLHGDGLLDTMAYRPNSVEYTGAATAGLTAAVPAVELRLAQPEGFSHVGALTLPAGDEFLGSAVIDPAGAYAYFGDWTNVGHVFKVDLATFTHIGTLTLPAGEKRPLSAVIDPTGAYAYFGTYHTFPARVVKVNLATFTRSDALTMDTAENDIVSALIDPAGAYAYFGTIYPGTVVKVNLATFTRTGALPLNAGEEGLWSAVIDPAGGFAYFGTNTSPGMVVKVNLASFTRVGALTLNAGEDSLHSAVIDPVGAYAYFGTETSPGMVVKVNLTTFTRTGALPLNAGENNLRSAVIDPAGEYAYLGTNSLPGIVVQVDLAAFTRTGALPLDTGEDYLLSAAIDPAGEYAYFATFTVPGRVVKIAVGASGLSKIYLPAVLRNAP